MSSPSFRAALRGFLGASWHACPILDVSDWVSAGEVPGGIDDAFLALQFIGGPETIATIGPLHDHSYREDGVATLHLCFPTGEDQSRALTWGGQLVALLRGRRLDQFTIDQMSYFSDMAGAAIMLRGRWHGWSATLAYTGTVCASPMGDAADWIEAGTPAAPSPDWVIDGTPQSPSDPDDIIAGTPEYPATYDVEI
jgi:hypothetical protein